jgi:hypothetical protein
MAEVVANPAACYSRDFIHFVGGSDQSKNVGLTSDRIRQSFSTLPKLSVDDRVEVHHRANACPHHKRVSMPVFYPRRAWRLAVARVSACWLLLCFVAPLASVAQEARVVQPLTLSFAAPIAMEGVPLAGDRNPTLGDVVRSSEGPTIFLVSEAPYAELLVGAHRTGFGTPAALPIKAYGLRIAEGTGSALWIGGVRDATVSIISTHLSHGYLAKVDRLGRLLWERDYGEQSERSVQSVSPLVSGDVVVSGKDNNRTWLARVSNEGNVIWERFVGLGKGSAVATRGGVIALGALDPCQCDGGYREDVGVWSFDQAGEMIDRRIVRQGINFNQRESAAQIELESVGASLYIFSVWAAYHAKPLEVTKLNFKGEPVWSKSFPKTVWRRGNLSGADLPARGLLANGDILFAMREQIATADIVLSRLDAASGDLSEAIVQMPPTPPPSCVERWGPVRFVQEEPEGKVLLFGSFPEGKGRRSCGWVGETALPKFQSR